MEIVKKYLLKILCVVALVALFFPMAIVTVEGGYNSEEVVVSGFMAAFQGYIAMLLIVGPIVIIAADYIEAIEDYKPIMTVAIPVVCIIVTFVAYLQAAGLAAVADNPYVDCTSSLGFGGVLCLIAHIGIAVVGYLENKDAIKAMIKK